MEFVICGGVESVTLYDPAYPLYSVLPEETFDGVISTDVGGALSEEDIPWIVDEIFNFCEGICVLKSFLLSGQKDVA